MKNKKVTLEELVNHLKSENRIHEKFSILSYNSFDGIDENSKIPFCGTIGCAFGEMPALDSDFYFKERGSFFYKKSRVTDGVIADYFKIPLEIVYELFYPKTDKEMMKTYGFKYLSEDATVEDVIFNIEQYLKSTKK